MRTESEGRKEKKKKNPKTKHLCPHPFKLVGGELLFDLVSIQG